MPTSPPDRGWCLVTGASRGIGRAVADAASAAGFGVIGWARTKPEGVATFKAGVAPGSFVWQQVDVADPEAVAAACLELRAAGIGLAALVLNAGLGRWRSVEETPLQEWRQTLSVNLDGTLHTLQGAAPLLARDAAPIVVGLLSDSALFAFANRAAYSASKAGMRALLETARLELREQGVRFTLLYPSRVDTFFAGSLEEGRPGLRPTGLTAGQVADVVAFVLCQPPTVELREVHLSAVGESFGPYHLRISS
jgi:NAD(P)-dependent dehydrogenase (short-subunit alcohol dehydrogenase family)